MKTANPSSGFELAAKLSAETDAFIGGRLFHELIAHAQPDCDIVALGGYGRRELCPASDIDLLFLFAREFDRTAAEAVVRTLAYPLWDRGLSVGLSVRTVEETLKDAGRDAKLYAALLDARLICGSSLAYQNLATGFDRLLGGRSRQRFLRQLAELNRERRASSGEARYRLEPNLKEGILREYHCLRWYANLLTGRSEPQALIKSGHLAATEVESLMQSADYLIAARYHLHEIAGHKTDQLSLEILPELSATMGLSDEGAFMRSLHRAARAICTACETCEEALEPTPRRILRWRSNEPPAPLDELRLIGSRRTKPSQRLRRQLTNLNLSAEQVRQIIVDLLTTPGSAEALGLLHDSGLLGLGLPVFEAVTDLNTFDPAHTYTVDRHSLRCLTELLALRSEQPLVWTQVKDQTVLRLAALLHDIGKGHGSDHSLRGASLGRGAALELGLSHDRAETVGLLIENHLKLAELALGRDLGDENTAYELARLIRSPENLAMLYLITIADTRATAPNLWNAWRASLVDELYVKAKRLLLAGEAAGKLDVLDARWQALAGSSGRLWALPQAYVLCYEPAEIIAHLNLSALPLRDDEIRLSHRDHQGHTALTICARERPGLFADLSGLLALNDIVVLSAKLFNLSDGTCIDSFDVRLPWEDFDAWPRLERQFRELTGGQLDLAARLARKKTARSAAKVMARLDNESSDFYSLLKVEAPESTALLHAVARRLTEQDLNIHRAYLASRGSLASMTFYLTDLQGEKLAEGLVDLAQGLMHIDARAEQTG